MLARCNKRIWGFVGSTAKSKQNLPVVVPLSQQWLDNLTQTSPNWREFFAETVSPDFIDLQRAAGHGHSLHSSRGLQGAEQCPLVVGVTDDFRLRGYASRHGLTITRLYDNLQKEDHPFVEWLRRRGSFFVGKIACATPFAFTEASELASYPAASAVKSGACDVAFVASIIGAAGSNAPVIEDVVCLKTSRNALPRATPPWSRNRSIGLVAKDFGTLSSLWSDIVGGHTSAFMGEPVSIAVPVSWIDQLNDMEGAGDRLLKALTRAVSQTAELYPNKIEIRSVDFDFNPRQVIDAATTIANFELAESVALRGMEGTGLLQDLPSDVVTAIYQGKNITQAQYDAAKQMAEAMRSDFEEEMGDADAALIPSVVAPFQSGNLRSVAGTLPFALMACPMVSMRVPLPGLVSAERPSEPFSVLDEDMLPMFLVAEPGQDSQVIEVAGELIERLR